MKTLTKFQKLAFILSVIIMVIPLNSCDKDDEVKKEYEETVDISGVWEFTLYPLESYQDTTVLHGLSAIDYPETPATFSEVYLYEDEANNIKGETLSYRILGTKTGNNVNLNLYVYPNGPYDEFISIDSMSLFSSMELVIDDFGFLKGVGNYSEYPDYPNIVYDTYEVTARKLSDITISYKESKGWTNKLCKLISKFDSYLISDLTDNVFRPMYGCYGHKDGGGYYVFGHEGPGNKLPIYTSTIYFPMEWSWCKVRKYSFRFKLGGETHAYSTLKKEINKLDHALDIFHKWGFNDGSEYFDHLDDFINSFGGFAISILYDTHTHNIGLYVNHHSGKNKDVLSHPFVTKLRDALDPLGGHVYVYTGKDIHTHWHLRRSDFLVCNSQIYIFYLIGTHKVHYD